MDPRELKRLRKSCPSIQLQSKCRVHMHLQPSLLGNFIAGASQELKFRLFKYHKDFDGVLMHFESVSLADEGSGSVHLDDDGFPHITVSVDAYVFRPAVGSELTATVVKTHPDSLECQLFDRLILTVVRAGNEAVVRPRDTVLVTVTEVTHRTSVTKLSAKLVSVVTTSSGSNKHTTFDDDEIEEKEEVAESDVKVKEELILKSPKSPKSPADQKKVLKLDEYTETLEEPENNNKPADDVILAGKKEKKAKKSKKSSKQRGDDELSSRESRAADKTDWSAS